MTWLKKLWCLIFEHRMETRVEQDEWGLDRVRLLDPCCLRCGWMIPRGPRAM